MQRNYFLWFIIGLFAIWGYLFPYEWWQRSSHSPVKILAMAEWAAFNGELTPLSEESSRGESLRAMKAHFNSSSLLPSNKENKAPDINLSQPVLDDMKKCFNEGPVTAINVPAGDMGALARAIMDQLGPISENILLEKKAVLKLPDGRFRTLVYEWLGADEGSDVYWHEDDNEGFPRPVDLPNWAGHDLNTFDQLKMSAPSVTSNSESRLLRIGDQFQLAIDKKDNRVESITLKDEGHLTKCKLDPIKNFICDCLN